MSLDGAIRHLAREWHADIQSSEGHWTLEFTIAERRAGTELRHLRYRINLDEEANEAVLYFEDTLWERVASARIDLGGALREKEEAFRVGPASEGGNVEEQRAIFEQRYDAKFDFAGIRRRLADVCKAEGYVLRHLIPLEDFGGKED